VKNDGGFVSKHKLNQFGLSLMVLGVAALVSTAQAQGLRAVAKVPTLAVRSPAADAAVVSPGTQTYHYSLLSFPGSLATFGAGINPGVIGTGIDVVGSWSAGQTSPGFVAHLRGSRVVTESYETVNDSAGPEMQQAYSVNDYGTIVGDYIDASGIFHGYEKAGTAYSPLEVPFTGAAGTYSPSINNNGEVVGGWSDSSGNSHGFVLINGVYTAFDYPDALSTAPYGVNSEGNIVGFYFDAGGNVHGFLRKGAGYNSIDYPGAIETFALGVNDEGDVVGGYCLTSECVSTGQGQQGFLLRNETYTSFAIAGEAGTLLTSINSKGVLLGNYMDAAGLQYTFLAKP
jgi:hypothetical protein